MSSTNLTGFFILLCFFFNLEFCTSTDTITSSQFIKDPESIISNGTIFKLGFFSTDNSTNRYVGIWYNNISVATVIWVANWNNPIKDSSGILTISEDGYLVVLNGQKEIVWPANVLNVAPNSTAQLLDSGNLVFRENSYGSRIIWESFQQPSDTFMPKMKLSTNVRTNQKVQLTSWKSRSDPSIGTFSFGIDPLDIPEVFIWNESRPYWRSGPWIGQILDGVREMKSSYLDGFDLVDDKEGTFSLSYAFSDNSYLIKFVLSSDGQLSQMYWDYGMENWVFVGLAPQDVCDVYGICGAFGSCNIEESPMCSCLRGFEPKNIEEWNRGNWTSGCARKIMLQCERIKSGGELGKADGFLKLEMVKVPDFAEWSSALEDNCRDQCLNNCSCLAYAFDTGIGCMWWSGSLIDIRKFSGGGVDLYIHVADPELDRTKKRDIKVIIIPTVIIGTITIAFCTFFSWRWMAKYRARNGKNKENNYSVKLQDLPFFKLKNLATATNNFHIANKLGQGGFGPVYRGKLLDGQEIAVKRLSTASGQGLEEFVNEVVLISKLQHRNLVRLLGCCVEGGEKMLVYEYMPNKSLDAFLFDPLHKDVLDWRKCFNIIEGIGRGILYLHRDSRLRIIHRDLKASNILLDEELNPKISDFGTARIFEGNVDQAKTRRVVGTYGYMSPEYVMEGRFSEKSDVFSFGVLLLEIVSRRRNTSFYNDEQSLSLLGYVWKLWTEDNIVALIEPSISDPCFRMEMKRCIHVGLLCVQESVKDRPYVSTVISMLNSEIVDLPTPKKPAFTERQIDLDTDSPQQSNNICSINNVSVTVIQGR